MQALKFFNFSNEDFSYTWDSERYDFPAGEAIKMPDYLARHFAKHLVDRELNKLKKLTADPMREEFMKKALPTAEPIVEEVVEEKEQSEQKMVIELMNEEPKKSAKKSTKKAAKEEVENEEEFADLNK